jgi:hypothetical protein
LKKSGACPKDPGILLKHIFGAKLKKSGACPKDPGNLLKHIFGAKLGGCITITNCINLKKDPTVFPLILVE